MLSYSELLKCFIKYGLNFSEHKYLLRDFAKIKEIFMTLAKVYKIQTDYNYKKSIDKVPLNSTPKRS